MILIRLNLKIRYLLIVIFVLLQAGCTQKPTAGKQVLITKGWSNKIVDAYWLYLPRNYDSSKTWPVILFLQGGHGVSPNPETSKNDGPAKYALLNNEEFSEKSLVSDTFIIINPHMQVGPSEKRQWYQYPATLAEIVDDVVETYSGDPKKVYLTGLSRGGIGSWELAKKLPLKFAAIVPIAGRITCNKDCGEVSEIPQWIIHNTGDPVVEFDYSNNAVAFIEESYQRDFLRLSGLELDEVQLSEDLIFSAIDAEGHDAWNLAYKSQDLYKWLLAKNRD